MPFKIPLQLAPPPGNLFLVPVAAAHPTKAGLGSVSIIPVVLDTGASRTTFSPETLRWLEAAGHPPFRKLREEVTGVVGAGQATVDVVCFPRLQVGNLFELTDWEVSVAKLPPGFAGLLGGDVLREMGLVTLSYDLQNAYIEGQKLPGQAIQTA